MLRGSLTILMTVVLFAFAEAQKCYQDLIAESFLLLQMRQNGNLTAVTRSHVEEAIESLPVSLQWFYAPEFCLNNAKYGEYLYVAGIDVDDENRFAFSWVGGKIKANGGFVQAFQTDVVNGKLRVRYVLFNNYYQSYIYWKPDASKELNIIAAMKNGTLPPTAYWSVQFVNNNFVFRQNGRVLCSAPNLHDASRRFAYALLDDQYYAGNAACQWNAQKCPFSH